MPIWQGKLAKKKKDRENENTYFEFHINLINPPSPSSENIKITYSSSGATITWMETINCVPLGFAPLCSSFQNPISSMSSRSTFIRALPLDYLPPLPRLPRCCMLQCIKLNEVSVQVTLAPASHTPHPPLSLLVIKGEDPSPLVLCQPGWIN